MDVCQIIDIKMEFDIMGTGILFGEIICDDAPES